jgi:transcription elongation factor Elf1|tara:strand:- start:424 stop:873 length:450 start_codon:yes stop_codon:yes gene_type:complete
MIITCPCGEKKFEIDQKLIPSEGRMLQCGSCDHQWFFKIEKIINETQDTYQDTYKEKTAANTQNNDRQTINIEEDQKEINPKKTLKENDYSVNYFKLLLVIIITSITLILVLDTFKEPLETIFPNIQIILNNLYQSLKDIKLFILDLIK